jgi:hypothetical protein
MWRRTAEQARAGAASHVFEEEEKVDDEFSDIHSESENICYKLTLLILRIPLLFLLISFVSSRVLPLSFFFVPNYSPHNSTTLSSVNSSISFSHSVYFPNCIILIPILVHWNNATYNKPSYILETKLLNTNHATYYKPRYLLQTTLPTISQATY